MINFNSNDFHKPDNNEILNIFLKQIAPEISKKYGHIKINHKNKITIKSRELN